jgi:hypothetical protein
LNFRCRIHKTYAAGAIPIGIPGWPALAFCTASADKNLTVSIQSSSSSVTPFTLMPSPIAYFLKYITLKFLVENRHKKITETVSFRNGFVEGQI